MAHSAEALRAVPAAAERQFAWRVMWFLFLASMLNYMDRAVLGVLMPQVRRDLGLTNTGYGVALNAFLIVYAAMYVLGGRLADRMGCRRSVVWTLVVWSAANMLHAFATGLGTLSLFRGMLGAGEGAFYPAAIRGAAEWFPPEERAKAVGLLLSGISLGTLLTPPLVMAIAVRFGWRAAFVVTGALGLLLLPGWLLLHGRIRRRYGMADPAPAAGETQASGSTTAEVPLRSALSARKYWCALSSRAMTDAAWYFYLFWTPGYFQEVRGFTPAQVGALLWIPYFCGGVGSVGGAWLSSALIARGWSVDRGRKAVLYAALLVAALGGGAFWIASPLAALAVVSLALMGHQAFASNIHTVITEISPPRHVAVLYGITGAAGTLLGALSQPLIGRVVDLQGYGAVFAAAGLLYIAGAILLFAMGRIEPISPVTRRS